MKVIGVACWLATLCASTSVAAQGAPSPLHAVRLKLVRVVDSGSYFVYSYRATNAADSKGGVATIAVDLTGAPGTDHAKLATTGGFAHAADSAGAKIPIRLYREHVPVGPISPANWGARLAREGWLYWSGVQGALPGQSDSLAPGDSLVFGLRSPFLPGIRGTLAEPTLASCCLQAKPPRPRPGQFRVKDSTVAPTYAPGQVTLGVLADLLTRSCGQVTWITQADVCRELRGRLDQATASARRGDRPGALTSLRAFLDTLQKQHGSGKPVGDDAYWLLALNAQYLVAHAATAAWLESFPSWAVTELAALKRGGTAADWMLAHPTDTLTAFAPAANGNAEDWCARATKEGRLADSSQVIRHAYFYPPALTPQSTLPAAGSPKALSGGCTIGAVWVEAAVPTTADAIRLNVLMKDTLVSAYGTQQPWHTSYKPPFGGYSGWHVAGPWMADSTTILSAAETQATLRGVRAIALAYWAGSGLGPSSSFPGTPTEDRTFAQGYTRDSSFVAEGAALTGLEQPKVAPLFALLAQAESARAGLTHRDRVSLRAAVVAAVWHWLEYARPLVPPRRAAAYLAADRFLGNDGVGFFLWLPEDSTARRPLEAWGATFEEPCCEGTYTYAHGWLDEAVRLDPKGRAGNLAFLARIGGCDPAPIIERGEAFMENVSDSILRAQLHFALGDAYADSVGMAGQVDVGETYRTNVKDAPTARSKAIAHYRAGLAIDRTSPQARAAWSKAWRLLAGLPPLGLRFHCEAD